MKPPKLGGYERLRHAARLYGDGKREYDALPPLFAGWLAEFIWTARYQPQYADIEQEALKRWLVAAADWSR